MEAPKEEQSPGGSKEDITESFQRRELGEKLEDLDADLSEKIKEEHDVNQPWRKTMVGGCDGDAGKVAPLWEGCTF